MSQAQTGNQVDQEALDKAIVQDVVNDISHIATLPEVTLKIIKLVEDPDSTAQDLNKIITNDPALGARILKVVNSAFYGLPGQIGSINRAIVLLGLNAVKNIAIAASLAKLFRGGKICPQFNARDLWTHSIGVASATRMLADKAGLGLPDEAFLAGLIHDIGIMVEIQARRAKFIEAMEKLSKNSDATLRDMEKQTLGATHEQFGSGLCELWKFPASFSYVTGFHHHPQDIPQEHRTLAGLVYIADVMCKNLEIGFSGDVEAQQVSSEIIEEFNLTASHLEQVANELPEAIEEANILLS